MIYLKIILRDDKVNDWIKQEQVKVSSILIILKKNLGYKNQDEIITKTGLDPSFLRIKLCWRNDTEYSELTRILNGIVKFSIETPAKRYYYRGRNLLDYVAENGSLVFIPYYRTINEDGPKSLMFWTIEKSIERWIKEKF
jgi:hypothetical protein